MAGKDNYDYLADIIILQAVNDYREIMACLSYAPFDQQFIQERREIELFFRSEWFQMLTSIDGNMLIRRLRAEDPDDSKRVSFTDFLFGPYDNKQEKGH